MLLKTKLLMVAGGFVLLSAALFMAMQYGRAACRADVAEELLKAEGAYSEQVDAIRQKAYKRGLERADAQQRNRDQSNDAVEDAYTRPDAGNTCVDADLVERLRSLQPTSTGPASE